MKRDSLLSIIGFLLFVLGFLSIFLSLIGLNFKFLSYINNGLGSTLAFVLHLLMIMSGLILLYVVKQRKV